MRLDEEGDRGTGLVRWVGRMGLKWNWGCLPILIWLIICFGLILSEIFFHSLQLVTVPLHNLPFYDKSPSAPSVLLILAAFTPTPPIQKHIPEE